METIEITISPKGKVNIEAIGFVGESCRDATAELERALGTVESTTDKPERWQQSPSHEVKR